MSMIELENVKKVLRNVVTPEEPTIAFRLERFTVSEGSQMALVGPSGCGKSTLLNLVSGVLRPDEGAIIVAGQRIDRMPMGQVDRFRGRTVGYIYQDFNLIEALTAIENVMVGLRFARALPRAQWLVRAREMLDRVGLGHRRQSRPAELSVGERQRVAIARALVNHPPLILADEPTANLDPRTARQVFLLLQELCHEGTHTLVVVTHDVAIADRLPERFDCTQLIRESDQRQ